MTSDVGVFLKSTTWEGGAHPTVIRAKLSAKMAEILLTMYLPASVYDV